MASTTTTQPRSASSATLPAPPAPPDCPTLALPVQHSTIIWSKLPVVSPPVPPFTTTTRSTGPARPAPPTARPASIRPTAPFATLAICSTSRSALLRVLRGPTPTHCLVSASTAPEAASTVPATRSAILVSRGTTSTGRWGSASHAILCA